MSKVKVDIEVGDVIEFREDGFHCLHVVYKIIKENSDVFVMAQGHDNGSYSAFYWSKHGKGVKIHKKPKVLKSSTKSIGSNYNYSQIDIFKLGEESCKS